MRVSVYGKGADVSRCNRQICSLVVALIGVFLFFEPIQSICMTDMEAISSRHYSTRHGLPSNHIEDIEQDTRSRIVLSTQHGLSVFDGQEFKNYQNFPSGLDVYIRCTSIDKNGVVWFGTLNGLGVWENGNIHKTHLSIPGKRHDITDMEIDGQGTLWFICNSRGPYCIQQGKLFSFVDHAFFREALMWDLDTDQKGNIWFATDRGVFYHSGEEFVEFKLPEVDLENTLILTPIDNHHGWLALNNGCIIEYENNIIHRQKLVEENEAITFFDLEPGNQKGVWIATSKGLYFWQKNSLEHFTVQKGLNSNLIMKIVIDQEGLLWYGSDNGLGKITGLQFRQLRMSAASPLSSVMDLDSSSETDIWVATSEGLVHCDGNELKLWTSKDGLADDYITLIHVVKDGSVLANTPGYIYHFENDSFTTYPLKINISINDFARCPDESIWVATDIGIGLFKDGEVRLINSVIGFETYVSVFTIMCDEHERMWIATEGNGSYYYDFTTETLRHVDSVKEKDIFTQYEDKDGYIWLGTLNGAYQMKDDEIVFKWTKFQGLASDSIWSILQDQDGAMWFATSKGLSRLKDGRILNFDVDDGLSGDDFIANCTMIDKKHRLWFGGSGITIVNPEYTMSVAKPHINLKFARADGNRIYNGVDLPHDTRVVEFKFVCSSLLNEDKNMFRYQLKGFDDYRSQPTHAPIIRYTNLPTGRYQLIAEAMNRNEEWTEDPYVFNLVIKPAFYELKWVQFCFAIIVLLIIAGIAKLRTSAVQRRARWLKNEVDEKTKVIQEQLQVLEKQKEQLQYLAITDDLTKLHNRRYFFTTLANEWKRSERYKRSLSIILFDIDHFKQFNDTHGHAIGDEVLKHVADIIKLTVREIDTVARFGGEEFMVLLPETDLDTAIGIAERIRREVDSKDFNHPVIENLSVTISGGISTKCDEKGAMNPDGMIRQADMAMYKAKQGGRNRVEAYHG